MTVMPDEKRPNRIGASTAELGTINPYRVGGTLYEDFLPQLRGRQAVKVYAEMTWNDATVGAILYAIEQLVRQVDWTVESDDQRTQDFLEDNLAGLEHSWDDFISSALTEISFGWSMFEIVYQLVDAELRWRKFAFRDQGSLHRWELSDVGDLEAFVQVTQGGPPVAIPAEKLIHFRTMTGDGRPEGRSWLRRAYRSWFMKKRVEDITAIGIERDLNGIPMARVPIETLMAGSGDPEYDAIKKIVTGLKVDEMQGIMFPGDVEDGHRLFDLELLAAPGRSKTDSLQFIRTQAQDIASVMLAQFIGLGRDAVGSRALAEPQQELFQTALGALLDSIEEQFHRQATERLLGYNGMASGRIKHGELRDVDLEGISNFVLRIAQAGGEFFPPDGSGMDEFRQMAGLQVLDAVTIEDENTTPGDDGTAPPSDDGSSDEEGADE